MKLSSKGVEIKKQQQQRRKWFENRFFMITFDLTFSTALVTNLVIFVWRIIWDTQDLYLKTHYYLNSVISIVLSFSLIFYIKYKQFESFKHNERMSKFRIKLFIIVFSFANINHWRGVWNFTLAYTNHSVTGVFLIGAISLLGLLFMNRLCALLSVPFILNKDCMQAAYQVSPSSNRNDNYLKLDDYRLKMTNWLFLLNSMQEYFGDLFTIQSWRSLWFFMDCYLYPNESCKSALISVLIGLVVYIFLHIFAKPINRFVLTTKSCGGGGGGTHLRHYHNRNNLVALTAERSITTTTSLSRSSTMTAATNNHLITNNGRQKLTSKMPSFAYFNKDLNKRSPIINLDIRENYEKQSETHFSPLNRLFLYVIFMIGFLGTVSTWRGLWMLQMHYAYPPLFSATDAVLNQILLNLVYISLAILILWSLNLTSSLLSRASCKDDYFTAKKVYVLRFNNYKAFFHDKFIYSMTELMKLIKVKLLCRKRSDKEHLHHHHHYTNNRISTNQAQEMIAKNPSECAIIKLTENSV